MVFTSISFIYYFFPLLLICYFVVPKKFRNIILLMFSVLFYFYGELFINNVTLYYLKGYALFIVLGVIGSTNYVKNLVIKISNGKNKKIINILEPIYLLILLIIVTMYLIDSSYNPFLYFRF